MSSSEENSHKLSPLEVLRAKELQVEVKRKLAILLADPRTPESFKKAFSDQGEK